MANLYRLIRHMRAQNKKEKTRPSAPVSASDIKKEELGDKFPFLRIPDNPDVITMLDAEIKEKTEIEEEKKKANAEIIDLMATLESLAPSKIETAETSSSKQKRSRSPHKTSRRSRSRDRDRGRNGHGRRSRSRERRSRSRSRDRSHRDRRRDRDRRSRSRSAERDQHRDREREYVRQEKRYLSDRIPPQDPEVGKVNMK